MSSRGNVQSEKCPVGEIAARTNVWSVKMSSWGSVSQGIGQSGMCQSGKCRSGKCPVGEVSGSRWHWQLGNVKYL